MRAGNRAEDMENRLHLVDYLGNVAEEGEAPEKSRLPYLALGEVMPSSRR